MKTTRSYTMRARAESAADTRVRILDATFVLGMERLTVEIVLADVAERAGVSVQTVLRHFGSKDALFDAVHAHAVARVAEERSVPVGDDAAAVATIVEHYERHGAWALRMLAEEHTEDRTRLVVEQGRELHRAWVTEVFTPQLDGRDDADELTDLLVLATDVYAWKLLRRDAGLDRTTAGQRMLRMVRALLPTGHEEA